MNDWYGFDLDRTLAYYDRWRGETHIGEPILPMVKLVKKMLDEGKDVRIFTARVGSDDAEEVKVATHAIEQWCQQHIGKKLPVTCKKDYGMAWYWDDRCHQVLPNTGIILEDLIPTDEEPITTAGGDE